MDTVTVANCLSVFSVSCGHRKLQIVAVFILFVCLFVFLYQLDYKPDTFFQNIVDHAYSVVKGNSRDLLKTPSRKR